LAFEGILGPHFFCPEGFSLGARFSSSPVILRTSRAFVSRHSSLSHCRTVQVLALRRLVLTRHEPRPVLNLTRPEPRPVLNLYCKASRQNLVVLMRGGVVRVDGTQPESRERGDDHVLQSLAGLAYMPSLDL
jgi:hypothetical protein